MLRRPLPAVLPRRLGTGLGVVGMGVLLAACGSSGGSKAAGAGATAPVSAASGASSTPAAASATATSTAAAAASGAAAVTLPGSGSFCDKARLEAAQAAQEISALTAYTPAQLQAFEEKSIAQLPAFVAAAPAAIKSQVTLIANEDKALFAALKAANFDYAKLDPTVVAGFASSGLSNAAGAVTTYLATTCGIKAAVPSAP